MRYAFWNNKGGTGKTTLAFQSICQIAADNQNKRVLVVDVCPQANLSELLLGSMQGNGGENLLKIQGGNTRQTIGGYFAARLPSPYQPPDFDATDFITTPHEHNSNLPQNIDLLAGDPILELQANTMYTLANVSNPTVNTWYGVISWLADYLKQLNESTNYDFVFFDLNPSFALYTQIALAAADRVILPVMSDDSSRRAIQNAFSLIYGLKLPSPVYAQHSFKSLLERGNGSLPLVHLVIKNRLTQYMGPASGYSAILRAIDNDVSKLLETNPEIFAFEEVNRGFVNIRDFQTCGVVAAARGIPFYSMTAKRYDIFNRRIQVNRDQIDLAKEHIKQLTQNLEKVN